MAGKQNSNNITEGECVLGSSAEGDTNKGAWGLTVKDHCPAVQLVHTVCPTRSVYLPALQLVHSFV